MKVFVKVYANKNLGDDLFLKILFDRYPHCEFILEAPIEYDLMFTSYSNVTVYDSSELRNITLLYRVIRKLSSKLSFNAYYKLICVDFEKKYRAILNDCDLFLSIGGSIFMEQKGSYSYDICLYKFIINNWSQMPKFFLGCNFGPYQSTFFLDSFHSIFSNFTDTCFRDSYSYNLFSDIDNIRLSPDIVFSLPKVDSVVVRKSIGFVLRPNGKESSPEFREQHIKLISLCIDKGYTIKLFSFCENEGDKEFVDVIYQDLEKLNKTCIHKVARVYYDGNYDSFLSEYASVEYMVCERFHGMILSFINQQVVLPVMYSDKMANVLSDINFSGKSYTNDSFLEDSPANILASLFNNSFDLDLSIAKSSINHFLTLDKYITKENND